MSEKIVTEEVIVDPDDVYTEETVVTKKKPKKKRSKILVAGGIVLFAVAAASFLGSNEPAVQTTVVAPPNLNTVAGGDVQQNNPEYAQSLRQANDQNAQEALDGGRTFIPTPEGALTPINTTVESLPQPVVEEVEAPETTATVERRRAVVPQLRKVNETNASTGTDQTAQQVQSQEPPPENPYVGLISQNMAEISESFAPKQTATETFQIAEAQSSAEDGNSQNAQGETDQMNPQEDPYATLAPYAGGDTQQPLMQDPALKEQQRLEAEAAQANAQTQAQDQQESKVYVAAGDVMYAEVIATVNSDMPLPVIAEITTGDLKGARVRGTFTTDPVSGKMIVSFSQMTLGDTTVPVSAMAVDGYTADTGVRSGIEKRYLRRYGTVFATTFIEGLAEGLSEPEQTVLTDSNGNNQVVEEQRTTEESVWNGVNSAISTINQDLTQSTPKGPKVYLHAGYPIGVIFVDDLRENPKSDE